MTHTANPPAATIRARVHDSALKRVTRFFASNLHDIFTETLQNARRAGATRVRVTVGTLTSQPPDYAPETSETCLTVTVADDGAGIVDPAVLLSFGENGWSDDLVAREDAAGMGILSLAHRGCRIASRARESDWAIIRGHLSALKATIQDLRRHEMHKQLAEITAFIAFVRTTARVRRVGTFGSLCN